MSRLLNSLGARIVLIVAAGLLAIGSARADVILMEFMPHPVSALLPELVWDGAELVVGPGAIGVGFGAAGPGDGELPAHQQSAPGLVLETPLTVTGVAGSEVNPVTGATSFFNATLEIVPTVGSAGLPAAGAALSVGGLAIQPLGSATFKIWGTDPDDGIEDNSPLLLEGVINSAVLTGILGANVGSVLSADVTYLAGEIYDALNGGPRTGQLSWSLIDADQPVAIDAGTGRLAAFQANATGQFSHIPEPAALGLLVTGTALFLIRRRAKAL